MYLQYIMMLCVVYLVPCTHTYICIYIYIYIYNYSCSQGVHPCLPGMLAEYLLLKSIVEQGALDQLCRW